MTTTYWQMIAILIVWNRTVYMYKNGFGINNLQCLMCHKTKPNLKTRLQCWSFGNVEYPFIAIAPRSTLVTPDRVLSMSQIELNSVLMLSGITWNMIIFAFNLLWLMCHKTKPTQPNPNIHTHTYIYIYM